MTAATCMNNYEYLDILDRGWRASGLPRPAGGALCDIGCASFWYAATLDAFFKPATLLGVEVEGHRLFRDGRSRVDYAAGYLRSVPGARFVVADYARFESPADVITAWFPFVTAGAILAWRLPLSLLTPQAMMRQIHHNLAPQGVFFMVNHGHAEAGVAHELCAAAGLRLRAEWFGPGVVNPGRETPPVLSWWMHA